MRTKRSMAAITLDPSFKPNTNQVLDPPHDQQYRIVIEEIEGLIKVYKDGYVERPQIVPCVTTAVAPELGVASRDVVIDKVTNIWSRFYVPKCHGGNYNKKLPLLVYFHGGGFCVGSAAWSCYHEFLAKLAAKVGCLIMSVNYRLVPEHPLPAAYEDGFKSLRWLKEQAQSQLGADHTQWWSKQCDFSRIFLVGDSAGANIVHHVGTKLCNIINSDGPCDEHNTISLIEPLIIRGTILLQPFFGGEARTCSEKYYMVKQPRSVLSLAASDTYWRLALPPGANRDHPWCNPLKNSGSTTNIIAETVWPTMVCISELDILKDRNLEFCEALGAGKSKMKKVEYVVYKGVGHAFQVLDKSKLSKTRSDEMVTHIKAFVNKNYFH